MRLVMNEPRIVRKIKLWIIRQQDDRITPVPVKIGDRLDPYTRIR